MNDSSDLGKKLQPEAAICRICNTGQLILY
jgi:hypothetical protein